MPSGRRSGGRLGILLIRRPIESRRPSATPKKNGPRGPVSVRPILCLGAVRVAERANLVVIGDDALVLPLHEGPDFRRQLLLQRLFVLRLRVILAALAFFENRPVVP